MFPYVDFHWDWLAIQTENTKRRLLVLLCADMTVGTLELTKIFIRQLQRNTTIHESTARCILMRDMTIHDVYRQYQLKNTLSDDAKFWFAIRNSTEKELTIDYLFGGYIFYDQGPPIIYTLPQLVAIMNGYIKYLYDLEFPVQSLADRANAWFFEYMKFKSFPGEGHWGFNLVWFGSQNSSVQLEAVRELCTNPVYTPATVYSVFKTFFRLIPLEPEIHNEMRRCPKDKQSMSDHVALVSMFLGCAGFCGLMIVLFSLILYLEFRSFEKPNEAGFSHFNLVMLASLLCLLGEDIANAWFINSAIYNFETMISSTITGVSVVYSLTFVFNCGWSFSFLHLSYVRSESLVHLIWPTTYQYIKRAFLISPIVFLAPIIISALEIAGVATATLTWTSYAVSEVYLFVLDLVLLFTFIKFVRGVYVDSDISNQQFNAISRFSSVSSFLCLLITLSALARPIITEYTTGSDTSNLYMRGGWDGSYAYFYICCTVFEMEVVARQDFKNRNAHLK
ncbi:hypothetical protein BDR26DRAFT_314753 [Obelidium mucronatum]|nr:hypothetical protein BDR26DRAFT_314753 [Obelidium mucronatum]